MYKVLVKTALNARKMSYTPYSDFSVGAALLTKGGTIYTGCNIENSSYTPTNCAERTAFFKAVSEGEREFKAIAIVGGKKDAAELEFCYPCGVCRQVMLEFCDYDTFEVVVAKNEQEYKIYKLSELIPYSFTKSNLGK